MLRQFNLVTAVTAAFCFVCFFFSSLHMHSFDSVLLHQCFHAGCSFFFQHVSVLQSCLKNKNKKKLWAYAGKSNAAFDLV